MAGLRLVPGPHGASHPSWELMVGLAAQTCAHPKGDAEMLGLSSQTLGMEAPLLGGPWERRKFE